MKALSVLITGPSLRDPGGVAGYYNSVLHHLAAVDDLAVRYLEIGSSRVDRQWLYPIDDQLRFRRLLRRHRPDLVHVNPSLTTRSFFRDALFVRDAKRQGSKVIVFFRGWEESWERDVDRYWKWFFRETYGRADAFVVLATRFRDKLRGWGVRGPIDLGTTAVAQDLVDLVRAEKGANSRQSCVRILFLARLVREKGITETLVAVAALRDRGWPITLTIAGEGEAIGDVRRLVAFYDAKGEFLRLAGDVRGRDKATTFAYHDIYCLPTYGEGMPNAVLEAMACGMPVVTCPVGGLCDFFEDGKMGLFVEPRSPGAIAIALERLIADPGLRQRIGAYNAEYAASFLAPAVAKRLAAIYRAHA